MLIISEVDIFFLHLLIGTNKDQTQNDILPTGTDEIITTSLFKRTTQSLPRRKPIGTQKQKFLIHAHNIIIRIMNIPIDKQYLIHHSLMLR